LLTLQPRQFLRTAEIPAGGRAGRAPAFTGMPDTFIDRLRMTGIDLSPGEETELEIFEKFLGGHIQQIGNQDVQCMLLWSEWVRMYRRQESGFPSLIREKEFRNAVTSTFGAGIATDELRGEVFTGVRFIP